MSAKVDKFCDDLRNRLNAIAARMDSAKASIQAFPDKADKAVQDKVAQARNKVQAQKDRVEKARMQLKAWSEQTKAENEATIREWKAKHEAKKLEARAERYEASAEAAVAIALGTIDEAEVAIFNAVAARIDADACAGAAVP